MQPSAWRGVFRANVDKQLEHNDHGYVLDEWAAHANHEHHLDEWAAHANHKHHLDEWAAHANHKYHLDQWVIDIDRNRYYSAGQRMISRLRALTITSAAARAAAR